jgi:hypothetical protein
MLRTTLFNAQPGISARCLYFKVCDTMLEDGCLMESLTKLSQYVHENADKLRSAARSHGKATLIELLALSVPTKKREGNKTEAQWYKWLSRHRSSFKEEENNLLRNLDNSLGFATVTLQTQLRDFEAFLRENKAKLKKTQGSSLLSLLPNDGSWPEGRSWRNWLARNHGHLMENHGTQLEAIQKEHSPVDKAMTIQTQLCDSRMCASCCQCVACYLFLPTMTSPRKRQRQKQGVGNATTDL